MNASELRIGNAVYCKYRQGYFLVKEIAETWLRITDPKKRYIYSESYETVLPIELSPEILEACGFESVRPTMMPGYAFYRSKSFDGRHRFRWESVEGFAMETVGSGWLWHFKDIKYLHQIQNFAYSITGTELTINFEKVKV